MWTVNRLLLSARELDDPIPSEVSENVSRNEVSDQPRQFLPSWECNTVVRGVDGGLPWKKCLHRVECLLDIWEKREVEGEEKERPVKRVRRAVWTSGCHSIKNDVPERGDLSRRYKDSYPPIWCSCPESWILVEKRWNVHLLEIFVVSEWRFTENEWRKKYSRVWNWWFTDGHDLWLYQREENTKICPRAAEELNGK